MQGAFRRPGGTDANASTGYRRGTDRGHRGVRHHSYAATYDVTKEVKLEGKLVQFVLRNPHSFVHMEAPDEHGMTQRWAVEWAGTAQLGAQGVKRESLKVGDAITVTARPSRVPGEQGAHAQPAASARRVHMGHAHG